MFILLHLNNIMLTVTSDQLPLKKIVEKDLSLENKANMFMFNFYTESNSEEMMFLFS